MPMLEDKDSILVENKYFYLNIDHMKSARNHYKNESELKAIFTRHSEGINLLISVPQYRQMIQRIIKVMWIKDDLSLCKES